MTDDNTVRDYDLGDNCNIRIQLAGGLQGGADQEDESQRVRQG